MPTYEYRCNFCGYQFEELQSIAADPLLVCPSCSQPSLKRLLSGGSGLVFKGSGFYLTDYKQTNSSQTSPSSTKTDSSEKSKSSADISASASTAVEKSTV